MFPEISREDIFRLETRRPWLRCPQASDVAASGDPYRDAAVLSAWRDGNAGGGELHLLLTGRGADRAVIGAVGVEPLRGRAEACGLRLHVWLDERARGAGLATEAVQATVDVAFMLTETPLVSASARVLDPAFRRVLEKCVFSSCGTGFDPSSDGRGLMDSDRFRLDRRAWSSLKGWRVPDFAARLGRTSRAASRLSRFRESDSALPHESCVNSRNRAGEACEDQRKPALMHRRKRKAHLPLATTRCTVSTLAGRLMQTHESSVFV